MFISFQSPCSSYPCQNAGACETNYRYNTFECFCENGFTGEYCEKGNTVEHINNEYIMIFPLTLIIWLKKSYPHAKLSNSFECGIVSPKMCFCGQVSFNQFPFDAAANLWFFFTFLKHWGLVKIYMTHTSK